jgi:hypothetical protein
MEKEHILNICMYMHVHKHTIYCIATVSNNAAISHRYYCTLNVANVTEIMIFCMYLVKLSVW